MLPSTQLTSTLIGVYRIRTSVLAITGLLLLACSSGEATPQAPAGSAGTAANAGAGTASGGSTTAGTSAGGTSTAGTTASGGQAGSAVGAGGATSNAGTASGMSGSGGVAGAGGNGGAGGGANEPFELKSSAFKQGEQIPLMYKCAEVPPVGQNQSPPLNWGPGPAGTKSYAIVLMHEPTPEHWVLWDIPASVTSLAANIEHKPQPAEPAGSKQSLADLDNFKGSGYLGPCPQAVNSPQNYTFTLYALDVATVPGLSATSTPTEAAAAVKMHLVGGSQGVSLTGTQIRTP